MRNGLHRVAVLLTILAMLATMLPPAEAGARAPAHPARRFQSVKAHFPGASAQSGADEDEIDGFEIAPIDPALDPDQIMRSRPFIVGETAYQKGFPAKQTHSPNKALDEEDPAREALVAFLSLRGVDQADIDGAVARFDDRKVKRIVPSPRLRATLLMLTGWDPYEVTIAAVLDGKNPSGKPYLSVGFEDTGFDGAIASLSVDPGTGRYVMAFDRSYSQEDPEVLIPTIVHESLHSEHPNSAEQEVIANILDTICWAELLLIKPELASYGTELVYYANTTLLAFLNSSGRAGPGQVGIATSAVGDVFVGEGLELFDAESLRAAIEQDWFYDALKNDGSTGQQTTAALMRRFPGGKDLGKTPRYDETMLAVIDAGASKIITAEKAVQLASLLGLDMVVSFSEGRARGKLSSDAAETLERRPFVVSDAKLFGFSTSKKTGKPLSEDSAREKLGEFLALAGADPALVAELTQTFDSASAHELIPDPSLRAAVLMLGGMQPWDQILAAVFDGKNQDGVPLQVLFAPLRDSSPAARQSNRDGDDDRPALIVNSLLLGESPELLASVIVESVLLHDGRLLKEEAIAAAALGTLAWADIIALEPSAATSRTWGVLQRNQYLLALLNTGGRNGRIGILVADDDVTDVLPGIFADAETFAEFIDGRPWGMRFNRHSELVAPNIFGQLLMAAEITPSTGTRGKVTYSDATLGNLDAAVSKYLTPEKALTVAKALKLGTARK